MHISMLCQRIDSTLNIVVVTYSGIVHNFQNRKSVRLTLTTKNSHEHHPSRHHHRGLRVSLGNWIVPQSEIRPVFNTYIDQDHLYSVEKTEIHRIHMQTHHKETVPQIPSHVIPCIKSMYTIYPKKFMRATATSHN